MEINIGSVIGPCDQFIKDGEQVEVSIVISAIKVEATDEAGTKLKVVSGCNLWRACENGACYFSLKARVRQ